MTWLNCDKFVTEGLLDYNNSQRQVVTVQNLNYMKQVKMHILNKDINGGMYRDYLDS